MESNTNTSTDQFCCVENCNNNSLTKKGIKYYPFPLRLKIKKLWEKSLTLKPAKDLIGIIPLVCSDHFEPSSFRKRMLKKLAVPLPTKRQVNDDDQQSTTEKTMTKFDKTSKRKRPNVDYVMSETDDSINVPSSSASSMDRNLVEVFSYVEENVPSETEEDVTMDVDQTHNDVDNNCTIVMQTSTTEQSSTSYQNLDNDLIQSIQSMTPSLDHQSSASSPSVTQHHNQTLDQYDEGFSFSELLKYVQQYIMQSPSKVNVPAPVVSIDQDDEYTVFGEYLKTKLNKFTVDQRNMAEYLMSKVLFEADIGRFKHTMIK